MKIVVSYSYRNNLEISYRDMKKPNIAQPKAGTILHCIKMERCETCTEDISEQESYR